MPRILILGVNPFEDLPGYQLLSLLYSSDEYEIVAADDSAVALAILRGTGTTIEVLPHPSQDPHLFTALVARLCREKAIDVLLPGTDSHLYALATCIADQPQLASLCPSLRWLHDRSLLTKTNLQDWAGRAGKTPQRWPFPFEKDAYRFTAESKYPIMVKGQRKGAVKCDDDLEAVVARRAILRNPANQGPGGGVYAEAFVDGEEHSLLLLADARGDRLTTFGFRKLATTQLGTTVAAQVSRELPQGINLDAIFADLSAPTVLELEWRKDASGSEWLFEVNVRFPSWIGAVGAYGVSLLKDYIRSVLKQGVSDRRAAIAPHEGAIFYRLPQSGFLPLETAFTTRPAQRPLVVTPTRGPRFSPVWRSASPHPFRVK
jgi:hypothetical protein